MTPRLLKISAALLTALLFSPVAQAQSRTQRAFGWQGWGPRVGISSDPDQITGGVHFDLGDFAPGVRFQPSVDLGFGDDVTTLTANGMVAYYFPVDAPVTPYAGGQVTVAFYDFDSDCKGFGRKYFGRFENDCDTETEIGPMAVGGIEMPLEGGNRFLAEMAIGIGDLPDVKITAGWTF